MVKRAWMPPEAREAGPKLVDLPRPTLRFRLEAWRAFQRALDPLAPPKPLRPPRQRQ
jgi:hypothetical protein